MGTVAKFGQVPGVGANAIRPNTDAKKRPGFYTKKPFWSSKLGAVSLA